MRRGLALAVILCAAPVAAQDIDRSPIPPPNPVYLLPDPALPPAAASLSPEATPAAPLPEAAFAASLRPQPRPAALAAKVAAGRKAAAAAEAGPDLLAPPPPEEEPELDLAAKKPKQKDRAKEKEAKSKKGSVCGVAAIKGEKIAPITSKVKGCGLKDGVRVT